mmetsp:Transcript_116495/g.316377  ORF Transcript_116495/g.316377 Transcript_116495/m.316377 type:complete len:96 (+) Transcript_116495:73-360(+)
MSFVICAPPLGKALASSGAPQGDNFRVQNIFCNLHNGIQMPRFVFRNLGNGQEDMDSFPRARAPPGPWDAGRPQARLAASAQERPPPQLRQWGAV